MLFLNNTVGWVLPAFSGIVRILITMRKIISLLMLILVGLAVRSQDSILLRMMLWNDSQDFESIIKNYSNQRDQLGARGLYYLARAYYMTDQDSMALILYDQSLAKDPQDAEAYAGKAYSLIYLERYKEAIPVFEKSIALQPDKPRVHTGMGDAFFYDGRFANARQSYMRAVELDSLSLRPYAQIASTYLEEGEQAKALEWYYRGRPHLAQDPETGRRVLFNIGLIEYLVGSNEKAMEAFEDFVEMYPDDYHAYAKLIQTYYRAQQYEKALPWRKKLFEAHAKDELPEHMKDAFCFDQFKWKENDVQVFERFQEGKSKNIYYKHIFYVLDKEGEVLFSIQTEYSPYAVELGTATYLLGMNKGNTHSTFGVGFKEEVDYPSLKTAVMQVLEGQLDPAATSTRK